MQVSELQSQTRSGVRTGCENAGQRDLHGGASCRRSRKTVVENATCLGILAVTAMALNILPTKVDVVIIGGGLAGLTCAVVLADRGIRVAVLELD